jgi:non-homologous end joining protein Ku
MQSCFGRGVRPGRVRRSLRGRLRKLIEEKKKGHVIKPVHVANDDTKVIDLMAALRNSLKAGADPDRPVKAAASDGRREPSRRGPAVKPRPRGGRHAA